jgi:hypothetical protein
MFYCNYFPNLICKFCLYQRKSQKNILRYLKSKSRGSSVSIVSDCGLDDQDLIRDRIFPLAFASRLALGPTQSPVQWVLGVRQSQGVMLTTYPPLVLRLKMSRSYTSSHPHAPPWHVVGSLYFYLKLTWMLIPEVTVL